MKRNITLAAAFALALASSAVFAETSSEAIAEPAEAPVVAPAPAEAAPAVEIPADIQAHIANRFPGADIKGVEREGCTYVVELGDGSHIRYDNCYNPICYGHHDNE